MRTFLKIVKFLGVTIIVITFCYFIYPFLIWCTNSNFDNENATYWPLCILVILGIVYWFYKGLTSSLRKYDYWIWIYIWVLAFFYSFYLGNIFKSTNLDIYGDYMIDEGDEETAIYSKWGREISILNDGVVVIRWTKKHYMFLTIYDKSKTSSRNYEYEFLFFDEGKYINSRSYGYLTQIDTDEKDNYITLYDYFKKEFNKDCFLYGNIKWESTYISKKNIDGFMDLVLSRNTAIGDELEYNTDNDEAEQGTNEDRIIQDESSNSLDKYTNPVPEIYNTYGEGTSKEEERSMQKCPYCVNGRVIRETTVPHYGFEPHDKICEECGILYKSTTNHYHTSCDYCHGSGYIRN